MQVNKIIKKSIISAIVLSFLTPMQLSALIVTPCISGEFGSAPAMLLFVGKTTQPLMETKKEIFLARNEIGKLQGSIIDKMLKKATVLGMEKSVELENARIITAAEKTNKLKCIDNDITINNINNKITQSELLLAMWRAKIKK